MQIFIHINPYKKLLEAKLSKSEFERRKNNFHKRMFDIKQNVTSLNEDQHNILSEIANMRHTLHVSDKSLYNTQSSLYEEGFRWLESINDRLQNLELPKIKFKNNWEDYPTNMDVAYRVADNEEDNLSLFYEFHNQLNTDIENYLSEIDKKHNTNYSPTGKFRYD